MSGAALGWAKKQLGYAPCKASFDLLKDLADYADELGCAWPAVATLAEESMQSARTVQRLLKKLVEHGLLRRMDVVDRHTGRTRTCAYWFPISEAMPSVKIIASYENKVGGRVTLVSPWEGDTGVTLEGDTWCQGEGDTAVTPIDPPIELSEPDGSSARARADEDAGFERFRVAYPASGQAWADEADIRTAFGEAASVDGVERIVDGTIAYAADFAQRKAGVSAPNPVKFLGGHRYRPWAKPIAQGLGEVAAAPPAQVWPDDVRAVINGRFHRDTASSVLGACDWDGDARTLTVRTGWAASKISEVRRALGELGITVQGKAA